ncbi:MAG: mechanosensitive ion channel family protein [Thermoproteus sp.]
MHAVGRLVMWIVLYVIVSAVVQFVFSWVEGPPLNLTQAANYQVYVNILLALFFGWQIISAFAEIISAPIAKRQGETAGRAVSNLIKILGIGALAASIAGAVSGGPAAAALGGFIGLVIGFATQQVLGQAVAGTFLLLARPFKIGDKINAAGQEGVVKDITAMFTTIEDKDGNTILVPNNQLVGTVIKIFKKS